MINTDKTIVYVTREIERALGMAPNKNFVIVSNKTPYGEKVQKEYPDFVRLIQGPDKNNLLGTTELLAHPETAKVISPDSLILVFKNTLRVETEISAHKWNVINPKSYLAERVENKLSQIRWLGDLGTKHLPPHTTKLAKTISWKNDPFIIQWAHGHTGDGTILLKTREDLVALQERFPERMARLTNFISGPSFTVNAVVASDKIIMGNISYQITGLQPFTDNEFSTIGNDWGFARKALSETELSAIRNITKDIGLKLQRDGWRGLFGIDVIMDEKSKRIYLIEVNARQPASTTYESFLEEKARATSAAGITTFEAHLLALLGMPINDSIIEIKDGSQIIQRVTKSIQAIFDDIGSTLEEKGYQAIVYQNTDLNADLLRVQSETSIMDSHGSFNAKGNEIAEAVKTSKLNLGV